MDIENERVLKLIFPDGLPENLRDNPELPSYLQKLGAYKVDQLKKEESRLAEENASVVEQTQDLAISNYKTFIQTAECSRSICSEFQRTERMINSLVEKLPQFSGKCEEFLDKTSEINSKRRLNSITLKRNAQLLEILEMPQLMDRCIREGRYEEALELASYVQKMGQKHGDIPVIKGIVSSIESSWHTMLVQLLAQLRTDLQLPKCLQVVGYLRRMQAFGNNELKLKFLQARDAWLSELLNAIPRDDPQQHLTKVIELTRINLFNIITQYKAIFSEDDSSYASKSSSISNDGGRLFQAWLQRKIDQFLKTLEDDLQRGVSSLDTVLGQCMYFGLSFSRVGADFRGLMIPIFVRVILQNFTSQIRSVTQQFEADLERYTLINKVNSGLRRKSDVGSADPLSPPETLLDFHPLATLCNGYLNTLNELRLCAPISLADDVTKSLQSSLETVARNVLRFYRQEHQAFTGNERENFVKFCSCFAYDLIPYVQRCIHAIFPQSTLTSHLGISLMTLQNEGITFFGQKQILEPLKHLLPDKVDAMLMQVQEQTQAQAQAQGIKTTEIVQTS